MKVYLVVDLPDELPKTPMHRPQSLHPLDVRHAAEVGIQGKIASLQEEGLVHPRFPYWDEVKVKIVPNERVKPLDIS